MDETVDEIYEADASSTAEHLRGLLTRIHLQGRARSVAEWFSVVFAVYILITAVAGIGAGFRMAAGNRAAELFDFADNPFVGLVIGILATVLTQSSTTTTSIAVGMVAGGLPIDIAIPILLGANVGTTVTSSLVSFGMARNKKVFRRAFGAATVHDMYNLLSVLIFLPLELMFRLLERSSGWLTGYMAGSDGGPIAALFGAIGSGVQMFIGPGADVLVWVVSPLPVMWGGITLILIGVLLILAVINFIGRMLKVLLVGRAERILFTAIGRGPATGILSGLLITVMVQSSTTTTSLTVPLVGSGKLSVKQIYPFTVGANIGTTLTALIAAFAFTGIEGELALQAAFVHVLYNLFSASVIFGLPFLRPLPVRWAKWLARIGSENKVYIVAWVLGIFVVIPGLAIVVTVLV
ncbi:MAG: Na/Pi symporter [Ancrocorticia sp.]